MRQTKLGWVLLAMTALAVAAFGLAGMATAAETPLPDVREYVTDTAGMLQEEDRIRLSNMLYEYANDTSNQIVVVTIPTLGGEDIVSYSNRLFARVKPGRKDQDNGAILLIAREERKMRIETGYGLEPYLPDGRCGMIIRQVIRPAFQNGDIAGGIASGLAAMVKYVSPDYQLKISSAPAGTAQRGEKGGVGEWFIAVFIVIVMMVFNGWIQGSRKRRWRRGGLSGGGPVIFWGGGDWGSGSGGGFSDGGGFSGGGGDFGGGGASGDW